MFKKITGRNGNNDISGMNPLDYWYNNNDDLKKFIDNYYKENLDLIKNEKIKGYCIKLFETNSVGNKIQVLSLLSTLKNIISLD